MIRGFHGLLAGLLLFGPGFVTTTRAEDSACRVFPTSTPAPVIVKSVPRISNAPEPDGVNFPGKCHSFCPLFVTIGLRSRPA